MISGRAWRARTVTRPPRRSGFALRRRLSHPQQIQANPAAHPNEPGARRNPNEPTRWEIPTPGSPTERTWRSESKRTQRQAKPRAQPAGVRVRPRERKLTRNPNEPSETVLDGLRRATKGLSAGKRSTSVAAWLGSSPALRAPARDDEANAPGGACAPRNAARPADYGRHQKRRQSHGPRESTQSSR